jgi:hypothetical protein
MPAIIEAWFFASEKHCQGCAGPFGKLFRIVAVERVGAVTSDSPK